MYSPIDDEERRDNKYDDFDNEMSTSEDKEEDTEIEKEEDTSLLSSFSFSIHLC